MPYSLPIYIKKHFFLEKHSKHILLLCILGIIYVNDPFGIDFDFKEFDFKRKGGHI
jgi:hypothetical protein